MTVTTTAGFTCEVNDNCLNDIEIIEGFQGMANGELQSMSLVINKMLKPEDKKRLYDHYREEDGRVPIDKIGQAVSEIVLAIPKAKK